MRPRPTPKFGMDLGGVLNMHTGDAPCAEWHTTVLSEEPGASACVKALVHTLGPENVFIISTASGSMKVQAEWWLHDTMHITSTTGLLAENIHFVPKRARASGKEPVLANLGITHYVDDNDSILRACWGHGPCRANLQQLFYFGRSGMGPTPPRFRHWTAAANIAEVSAVPNWEALVGKLNFQLRW